MNVTHKFALLSAATAIAAFTAIGSVALSDGRVGEKVKEVQKARAQRLAAIADKSRLVSHSNQ